MLGIAWFLFWQAWGLLLARRVFHAKKPLVRLWLGSVLGSVASMWAPVPFAFAFGFTRLSHGLAAVLGIACAAFLYKGDVSGKKESFLEKEDRPFAVFFIPLFLFWCFLVWSHTLQNVNGALYTGQCTYGDMSMHLGFITSLAEQRSFPPYYSILPTARISYPFLCDSVSASLYLLGTPLSVAYGFPMLFAFAQFACGFWMLGREICRSVKAAVLAFALFFFNGGLGMIYFIRDYSLHDLLTGFYKTPTNLTEKGMRWVNVMADMLLPQRATLFGWAALAAALYLLFRAVFRDDRACFLPAGILGGLLPMIHTHSFFALGLVAACWMGCTAFQQRFSRRWFTGWLAFGLPAVALAAPQLFIWTFRSVGGNASFLRIHFDWVNEGRENWLWFWLKNVGPVFLLAPVGFILGDRESRAVFSGAILIFVLCNIVVFQPNVYDNNKLLYVGYYFCCFISADLLLQWTESWSSGARKAFMAAFLILSLNAGVFTLAREALSGFSRYGYELFSAEEAAAANFVMENTGPDDVFLTNDNHDNPVAVLTGRNIVCGSPSYLYYHGLDYRTRQLQAEEMLTDPAAFESLKTQLDVDYVYLGYYEHAMQNNISPYLREHYDCVFSGRGIEIYKVD